MASQDIKAILSDDPGNPLFAEHADNLRSEGNLAEAMRVCMAGLTLNPGCHKGRLILARLYYEQGFIPFAVRELEYLNKALPQNKQIESLLGRLAPSGRPADAGTDESEQSGAQDSETVAETEFDVADIDLLEENK